MKKKDLPYSQDLEETVLGCILGSKTALDGCIDILEPKNFFLEENRWIFDSIKKCCQSGRPADVHIVAAELESVGLLSSAGGLVRLLELTNRSFSAPYIDSYVEKLKDLKILRDIITTSEESIKIAREAAGDPQFILDDTQRKICSITTSNDKASGVTMADVLLGKTTKEPVDYVKALEAKLEAFRSNPKNILISGVSTGFHELDKMINGLNPSTLTMLAACTSVGKTAFALNVATHVACKQHVPVGIFSLEMRAEELVHRIMCIHADVSSDGLVYGSLTDDEFERVKASYPISLEAPIIIEDKSSPKINELRSKARRMVACHKIKLLIVDYLTLIEPASSRASDNRQTDVASISRALKLLSRELCIPILCLAQLSRKVDDRPSHRPVLGDLRESGAIEHDSDTVLFLYRRDYYDSQDRPGEAEIIVAKNRHGRVGSVFLRYEKMSCRFHDGR